MENAMNQNNVLLEFPSDFPFDGLETPEGRGLGKKKLQELLRQIEIVRSMVTTMIELLAGKDCYAKQLGDLKAHLLKGNLIDKDSLIEPNLGKLLELVLKKRGN
jgi:hypothetical protein